ncbi:MAG TPA: Sec-independent protein translocase protein TatB [Devosia sp.]|nr:Sec-independent protein translocase protein TatB [Devosia sp.]
MFGIGWTEMLIIGVVALIVIGPKDLPVVMGRLGKAVSTIRRMGSEFQREINKTTGLDQITDLRKSITEPLKQTAAEITREFNKPLTGGGVAPSGVIKPAVAGSESVVNEIHAKVGMALTPEKPVESPAPIEALAPLPPVKKPRKPRAAKPVTVAEETPAPARKKPATPRKKRPPKAEA